MSTAKFSRQSFLGPKSEEIFETVRATIIGLGGGGSHIAQQLAHLGLTNFHLIDPDSLEIHNLNRTIGAEFIDIKAKTEKVKAISRLIKRINPSASVTQTCSPWEMANQQIKESQIIFGCVDSYKGRAEIEAFSRRFLIPYIDIGMDVHDVNGLNVMAGQIISSLPGAPCMRCLGFLTDEKLSKEAQQYGKAGGRPQVVWPNGVLASTAVGIFVEWFTHWHPAPLNPAYLEYDGNKMTLTPSNRLRYLETIICRHYSDFGSVGDPVWNVRKNAS